MSIEQNYIIVAPPYDDESGGNIFLHRLADELCLLGEDAVIWPLGLSPTCSFELSFNQNNFRMMSLSHSRIARHSDLKRHSIVVYPEIVNGNPLGASNVVRWLLYPPSFRGTAKGFGLNDIYFKASDFSDDISLTGGAQLLHLFSPHRVYANYGIEQRSGTCYMLRKQTDKPTHHDPEKDICLDGLRHEDIAYHFNHCERFICYDEATMYSQLAAVCGCLSIVVPGLYHDREAWSRDRPVAKYGVAFGFEDIIHAVTTRNKVAHHLQEFEQEGRTTVMHFVARTKIEFG